MERTKIRPVLKWVGGKRRLLPRLRPHIPKFNTYYEPFFGGGALWCYVAPEKSVIGDANPHLMNFYRYLRDNPGVVIGEARVHARLHSQAHFLMLRDKYNSDDLPPSALAGAFWYLNHACFNGIWRLNRNGHFNVPYGHRKAVTIDEDNLYCFAKSLARANLSDAAALPPPNKTEGAFVYADPPYHQSFDKYDAEGFTESSHQYLATLLTALALKGSKILVSNADTDFIRDCYKHSIWTIESFGATQTIAGRGKDRTARNELLIRSY